MIFDEGLVTAMIGIASAFMIILIVSLGLFLIFWLWALFDCIRSKLPTAEKLFWVLVILCFNVFGALLYFVISKLRGDRMVKSSGFKGKRLLRSKKDRMIAGICGGLGEYLEVDSTIIRLLWAIFGLTGAGLVAYIIAWVIVPEEN